MDLEDLIRRYIQLPLTPAGTGWYPILCKVCNDHGKKGPRGGFRFEDGKVAYHCFNCGPDMNTVFDPDTHTHVPHKMRTVLEAFGVPEDEIAGIALEQMRRRDSGELKIPQSSKTKLSEIEPDEIECPGIFYFLKDADPDDPWAGVARWYLAEDRGIDPDSYPFMLSKWTDNKKLRKWQGRVIVPIYKDKKLIFYQGRDLTGKATKKYESPAVTREKVIYGFDQLFVNTDMPLYVVEGWFDAFAIDGVALLGNELSKPQIEWLNRSHRKKVYIPDRLGDGIKNAFKALDLGWYVSTPDLPYDPNDCKDINDAIKRYGKLYVLKSIADHTSQGFEAHTRLQFYCDHGSTKNKGWT